MTLIVTDGHPRRQRPGARVHLLWGNEADALQAEVLTNDRARRIAVNLARLPELLGKVDTRRQLAMTRQYIIAAIIGVILPTSLGIGGFPPAVALAVTLTGATVILMMAWEGWP